MTGSPRDASAPLLEVRDLSVHFTRGGFFSPRSRIRAVDGVGFTVGSGETLALVGESGSGKSTTARAVIGLAPRTGGSVRLNGLEVPPKRHLPRSVRRQVQMVFQDPYSSLDPAMRLRDIIAEPLKIHVRSTREDRARRVEEAARQVLLDPRLLDRRPHRLSGGQRQRVAIARAIVLRPSLVICDEPMSALDVSTQAETLNLLKDLQRDLGLSYLFISHDLAVVRSISHNTAVMYLGRIVESGPTERVQRLPGHPYTAALLSASPRPRQQRLATPVISLEGEIASAASPPAGCRFHTRCPLVMDVCRTQEPPEYPLPGGGMAACHLHGTGRVPENGSVLPLIPRDRKGNGNHGS